MHMATKVKRWTLAELRSLPDDGNKYEVVHGELFVTPSPSEEHENIIARLARILDPYVAANDLGLVYRPRAVMRFNGSEVEPDLMVRRPRSVRARDWDDAPTPTLIVEVLSPSTRRRDREQKRSFYVEAGVHEYWIIDPERRDARVVRPQRADVVVTETIEWMPDGAREPLRFALDTILGDSE